MNANQYAQFEQAVESFHKRNNLKPGLNGPVHTESDPGFEGYFSWLPCECCGSTLGGQREDYSFVTNDNQTIEASICTDCVYYLAYGELDDLTMLEIAESNPNADVKQVFPRGRY